MTKREQTVEEYEAALGYEYATERLQMWERVYGRDRLTFTGDGERMGLTYRDEDEGLIVAWSGGPSCVLIPPTGPTVVVRLIKGRQTLNGLIQRVFKDPGSVFGVVIDDYVAGQATEVAA